MSEYAYVRLGPHRYRERFGLSFEDLRPGMRFCHRPGVDVSQQDNREESVDLLNNAQLHYDSYYAAQTEWKNPLGVSTMTVQRLLGMASRSWYRRRNITGIEVIKSTAEVEDDEIFEYHVTVRLAFVIERGESADTAGEEEPEDEEPEDEEPEDEETDDDE